MAKVKTNSALRATSAHGKSTPRATYSTVSRSARLGTKNIAFCISAIDWLSSHSTIVLSSPSSSGCTWLAWVTSRHSDSSGPPPFLERFPGSTMSIRNCQKPPMAKTAIVASAATKPFSAADAETATTIRKNSFSQMLDMPLK